MPYKDPKAKADWQRRHRKTAAGKAVVARDNAKPHRKAAQAAWRRTPKGRYSTHRRNARHRGIPFLLSFEEWWSYWEPYQGQTGLCMCRTGDSGAYAVGNVRIDTISNNIKEYYNA